MLGLRSLMDVELVRTSVYSLPSKDRVGAIVFDGAADMQLWPGPGPEADLREAWGDGLQAALDAERKTVEGGLLSIPGVCRVVRGRLHCDFLLWAATRAPEPGTTRSPAPDAKGIEAAVLAALEFVAQRSVQRVAFPALGAGPGELDQVDRLVAIARAAHAYHEKCFAEGRSPVVETVLICEPSAKTLRSAKNRLGKLAAAKAPAPAPAEKKKAPTKRRASSPRKKKESEKQTTLDPGELMKARREAQGFSVKKTYKVGDWMNHKKFGVGQVIETFAEQAIMVLFEDGTQKKLAHARG